MLLGFIAGGLVIPYIACMYFAFAYINDADDSLDLPFYIVCVMLPLATGGLYMNYNHNLAILAIVILLTEMFICLVFYGIARIKLEKYVDTRRWMRKL